MSDDLEHIEEEEDEFMVTGRITIEAGMNSEGKLQWRWKNEDIETALALGFIVVIHDELKDDIRNMIEEEDEDD